MVGGGSLVVLTGVVDRITYRSDENLYTVVKIIPSGTMTPITATGTFSAISPGEELELEGEWKDHPIYGEQLKVTHYRSLPPTTALGVERYLGSGLIKGVGPAIARKLVNKFGSSTLTVIEETPERLLELEGVGKKTAERIVKSVAARKEIERVMVFLQTHGAGTGMAVRIWKHYGTDAVQVLQEDPYRLAAEVWGIGFVTADKIATSMGLPKESPGRIQAGIKHALGQLADEGHVMVPKEELILASVGLLGCERSAVETEFCRCAERRDIILSEGDSHPVYLPALFRCEKGVAQRLAYLGRGTRSLMNFSFLEDIAAIERSGGYQLSERQRQAVLKVMQHSIVVVTGGPGTGKTTTLNAIMGIAGAKGLTVLLAAPTGRAAKRMTEATGQPARTIHRLLEFSPSGSEGTGSFLRNEETPLEADVVIVDEVSMVDVVLMYSLLKAIPLGCRLVLVGDVDQLPSVGPGSVLKDIIASGCVPVVELTEVFRQAAGSLIVTNAHRINRGEKLVKNLRDGDFFFIEEDAPQKVSEAIVELVTARLPRKFGFHPLLEIQVLTPMRLGEAGVTKLNELLQQALNPPDQHKSELAYRSLIFRSGDKVMQITNNYEKEVYNGDIGRIGYIDSEAKTVCVKYPDATSERDVEYDWAELDELVLSYAISVHKSQGSEYPAVVIPLTTQHFKMLRRNLLYTAVTRARKLLVLVGSWKAVGIAIGTDDADMRHSLLIERLREEFSRLSK